MTLPRSLQTGRLKGSKANDPRFDEAFEHLRRIVRAELRIFNFGEVKRHILKIPKTTLGFELPESILRKIEAGLDDPRTEPVLRIYAEYFRNEFAKQNKTSNSFAKWETDFLGNRTIALFDEPEIGGEPTAVTEKQAATPGASLSPQEEEALDLSWGLLVEPDPIVTSRATAALQWPLSLPATVGLDRTRQISICIGCNALRLVDELQRVEAVLKSVDKAGQFPLRTWSIERGWLAESSTEAGIVELSDTDLANISKDTVEGVVQRHFARHSGNPASSLVLTCSESAPIAAQRVGTVLRASSGASQGVPVEVLKTVTRALDGQHLRIVDAEFVNLICDVDATKVTDLEALARAHTPRLQNLLKWLSGKRSDEAYLGQLTARDLKLVILSGRFGFGSLRPSPNAIHRSIALVKAAIGNPDLMYALGSLPVEPEIVERLIHSPIHVRAVAGLITRDEMLAIPAPWFRKPVETWRHGRALNVRGGQTGWVQAAF